NCCRSAIAAEADNQGAGDQRSDCGDQSWCVENETGSSRTHPRRKEFRQPYWRPRKNPLDEESIHCKDEQQYMNILHPQVNDWRKDYAHQIIQYRRRLAPERIGKKAEAEEAEQGADVLHQPDQSHPALSGKARSICYRSEIAGNKTRNTPI